jgi:cytochrome c oxidase cbb3-type subunit 3
MKTFVAAVVLLIVAASWVYAQGGRGNPRDGQVVYEQHCLRCHGSKMDGTGPDAQYLIVPPANLQSQGSRAKTDWELLVTITNGALFTPMHGFRGKLTDQQILDVLSYIRANAPFDAVS